MADNLEKKVLVDLQLGSEGAKSALATLAEDVKQAATELKNLKAAVNAAKVAAAESNAEYSKEKVNTQAARTEYQKKRTAILEANQALKQSKQAVEAANGSYAQAQQRLSALGKEIKNAENGFNSSNKAIKAQIAEYNKLNTQLKSFDAKMGNHQRNVGNYEKSLDGIKGKLGELIPGFSQLSNVLSTAASGFNAMKAGGVAAGEGAEAAEAGMTGLGAAAVGVSAAIMAVVAALVIEGTYLLQFQTYADGLSKTWAGIKSGAEAAMNAINNKEQGGLPGTASGWADLGIKISLAFNTAKEAQGGILELNRLIKMSAVADLEENDKIRKDLLVIRNIKSGEIEVEKAYQDALRLTAEQYNRNKANQDALHRSTVARMTAGFGLTQKELDGLNNIKGGYTAIVKLAHDLAAANRISAASLDTIVESAKKGVEIEGLKETRDQMIQNREDQKQAKLEKQKAKADQEAAKAANDLLEAKRASEEMVNERRASIAKMLQDEMEGLGRELSMADEGYRQKLFKLQEFITKQKQLRNKTKSASAKSQFTKNINQAQGLADTFGQEHSADTQKLLTDYYKKTAELVAKGEDELASLQIEAIKNTVEREVAGLDEQLKVRQQGYAKEATELQVNISRLQKEIKKAKGDEKTALQQELNQQLDLLGLNADKQVQVEKNTAKAKAKIRKDAADREREQLDQVAVLQAKQADKNSTSANNKALLDAEKQAVEDKYHADISQEGVTNSQKLLLHQQYLDAEAALDEDYRKRQMGEALKWEQLVQNSAFSIIENAMQSEAQAKQVSLEKSKNYELQNTALTSTQKVLIDQKYQKMEGQAKVKQFKNEQKLNVGKAVMAGARAVVEDLWDPAKIPFDIATTAAEVAVILAQKPPAYAQGGMHVSDGRGALLPGYSKRDNVNAYLRSGEAVIVSEAMQNPWARRMASSINEAFGGRSFDNTPGESPYLKPGFAQGGVFNTFLPTGDSGMRPITPMSGRMHEGDLSSLINGISSAVANAPAQVIDIKDIAHQSQRMTNVIDRTTY